jgi:hypothetical protein
MVLLVDQLAILLSSVYPPNFGAVQWRFGTVGLAVSRATPFLLGDFLLLLAGFARDHRALLRILGALHLLIALVLLGALVVFGLDTLEIRQMLPVEARRNTLLGAARVGGMLVVLVGFCAWVGIKVIRSTPARIARDRAEERLVLERAAGTETP